MSTRGETHGHHLFLTPPEGALSHALETVIGDLARTYGGPVFAPHLTIAAEITEPFERVDTVAQALAALPVPLVTFQGLRTGTSFFKCCYLSVELSPALTDLHNRSREHFALAHAFDPHVSLAYGTYAPDVLEGMRTRAEDALAASLMPTVFTQLELWETEGKVEDWKRVARYPFAA